MIKIFKVNFSLLFLVFFSGLLAFGTWNPFVPFNPDNDAESGIGLIQLTSVIFIIYLLMRKKSVGISMKRWSNVLYAFYFIFALTALVDINNISITTLSVLIKLLLVIFLCILLPYLMIENKNYIYISIYTFSIVSSIIAVLFWCGFLESFITYSQGRFCLFGENPNSTSARFSLAFIFFFDILLRNPFNWSKIRYWQLLFLIPLINIVFASGSRGSSIILVISIFLYLILYPHKNVINKIFVIIFFVSIFVVGGIYLLVNNSDYVIIERLLETYNVGGDASRDMLNFYAISIWLDSPIMGEGIVGFQKEMLLQFNETRTVHNLYYYILSTSGIIGFIPFICFVYQLFKDAISVKKQEPVSFVVLIFMLLMAYKTGGILTYMLMWYVFSIIITFKLKNKWIIKL